MRKHLIEIFSRNIHPKLKTDELIVQYNFSPFGGTPFGTQGLPLAMC